jgi:hypothetical protein
LLRRPRDLRAKTTPGLRATAEPATVRGLAPHLMALPSTPSWRPARGLRVALACVLLGGSGWALAQYRGGGGRFRIPENVRTAREIPTRSVDTPRWDNPAGFERDVFAFARLRYGGEGWRGGVGGGSWATDLPDADLNLSYRLQQMTSLKVDPEGRIVRADDPDLRNYPFLMAAAPGAMDLDEAEVGSLRQYLLNGGFFLLTDFWGDREWQHFEATMKRVLPGHAFVEMTLDHPLYRCLFRIEKKNQVPRIDLGVRHLEQGTPTWERGPDGEQVHHRAIFDAKGRLMVLALHNSDDSDGWEREGESAAYFHTYAEGMAYPLAINVLFYVMTH